MGDITLQSVDEQEFLYQPTVVNVKDDHEGERRADVLPPIDDPLGIVAPTEKEDRNDEN